MTPYSIHLKSVIMMKFILPFLLVLLLVQAACKNKSVSESYCDCQGFHDNSLTQKAPVLDFHQAYKGAELGMFLNDIYLDTILLFDDSLITLSREEFFNTFRLNINESNQFQNSPQVGYAKAEDTATVMKVLSLGEQLFWSSADPIQFVWSRDTVTFEGEDEHYHILYALHAESSPDEAIRLSDITSSRISKNLYDNFYGVTITMSDRGAEKWTHYTQKNISNYIAILSFNEVMSAPIINGPITGGETLVSFDFTKEEAEEFSHQINCAVQIQKMGEKQFEQELTNCK